MIGSDGREIYRVVWPRGASTVQASDVAPRLSTLEGKTIGQLWDYLFRGDEIFPILEDELRGRSRASRSCATRRVRHHPRRGTSSEVLAALLGQRLEALEVRRRHLRDGLLRQLHARRVAGMRRR